MLSIDEKAWPPLLSVLIALIFPALIFSAVFFAVPSVEYYDYGYYETKEACEAAGHVWTEDEYGEYCNNFSYSAQKQAELESQTLAYTILIATTITIFGLLAILASLFLIKNKTIAYGLLGGGSITLFGVVSITALSFPPAFIGFLLLVLMGLIYCAVKKG